MFASFKRDTGHGVNGCLAYAVTCDERRGERHTLSAAEDPIRFALP
jgi:hypothetical protein